MQVTRVEVDTLFVPVTRPYSAGGREVTGNWHVLARVTTSDGVQGHGYIVALRQGLVAAVAQATRELSSQLVGLHVLEVEAAWERLARVGDWVGPGGLLHYASAGRWLPGGSQGAWPGPRPGRGSRAVLSRGLRSGTDQKEYRRWIVPNILDNS